jgi:spore coat protein U-like protein
VKNFYSNFIKSIIATLCITKAEAMNISSTLNASLNVPSFCSFSTIPSTINTTLDDHIETYYSFSFNITCNFTRSFSLIYTSSCIQNGKSCLLKNNSNAIGLNIYFNNILTNPNQPIQFFGNDGLPLAINTQIRIDKTTNPGLYSDTITLIINY